MSDTLNLRVTGMTCGGCASHKAQSVRVDDKSESVTPAAIRSAIETLGYEVQP